jgi:hypothetical protein
LGSVIRNEERTFFTVQPFRYAFGYPIQVLFVCTFDFTLPKQAYTPPHPLQLRQFLLITANIALDFVSPELRPCFGPFEQSTLMAMPETPVDQNHRLMFR